MQYFLYTLYSRESKKMTKDGHQLISKLLQKQTYTDNQTVMIAGEVECVVVKEGMVYQVTHFLSSGIYTSQIFQVPSCSKDN